METEFEDIRIIDLDLSRTTWSRVHEDLRVMFLRLSRRPPDTDWPRLFFEERDRRIVARRRGLWIEDEYISFDSLPAEVEKVHIPDIRLSIDYANRRYRELCWQRRLKRLEEQAGRASEQDEMLALQLRVRDLLGDAQAAAPPVAAKLEQAAAVGTTAAAAAPTLPSPQSAAAAESQPATVPPATPLGEFERRRDALKQRFRSAAANQDKEHK